MIQMVSLHMYYLYSKQTEAVAQEFWYAPVYKPLDTFDTQSFNNIYHLLYNFMRKKKN